MHRDPSLHDKTPTESVITDTNETDLAKLGVVTSGPGLPDALKNAPLSSISPSDIHVQELHSLSAAVPSRFVTWKNFAVQSLSSSKKKVQSSTLLSNYIFADAQEN
jgi:hypothetical protein